MRNRHGNRTEGKDLKQCGQLGKDMLQRSNGDLNTALGLCLLAHGPNTFIGSEFINLGAAVMLTWMGDHSGDKEFYEMAKTCAKFALGMKEPLPVNSEGPSLKSLSAAFAAIEAHDMKVTGASDETFELLKKRQGEEA